MTATTSPDDQEKADLKTIIDNVEASANPREMQIFMKVLAPLDADEQNDLFRFVIAAARYGLEEQQR